MGFLFFCLCASFLVLVGGAVVVALPLMVCFPRLALMGKLTPVWVVVLWTVAERTHDYLRVFWLRFDLDDCCAYVIIWVNTVSIFFYFFDARQSRSQGLAIVCYITVNTTKWYI